MPFASTDPTLERARLVAAHLDGLFSVTELAARFGVSRPTVYKWIDRYRDGGVDALADRPSIARTQPGQTLTETETLIVACRKAHPHWEPRKLLRYLTRRHPDLALPVPSTAGAILSRHGLTKKRRARRPSKYPGSVPLVAEAPNAVWTTDYKGQFRMGTAHRRLTALNRLESPSALDFPLVYRVQRSTTAADATSSGKADFC